MKGLKAPMKAVKVFVVTIAAFCLLYLLLQSRGRKVAKWRLDMLHIVEPSCQTQLLYSSGFLRESIHVFQVNRHCLVGDAAMPDETLTPLPPGDEVAEVELRMM